MKCRYNTRCPPTNISKLIWLLHIYVHNPCSSACPRVLRDRLVALLEDVDEAWAAHRRPWRNLGAGTMSAEARGLRGRRTTLNSGTRHRANGSNKQGFSSSTLAYLDSGAGPRKFWQAIAGPKFVDASWNIDTEVGRYFERGVSAECQVFCPLFGVSAASKSLIVFVKLWGRRRLIREGRCIP